MMSSSKDGRPRKVWRTSRRSGFNGIRRIATCGGTYQCNNKRCPYLHSFSKENKVQFKTVTARTASCACCGYEAVPIPCDAKKVWEFGNNTLMVYHCGNHSCVAKKPSADVTKEASHFFQENTYAKPSQFPYERLRGMLKDGKNKAEIYDEAKGMANLKKIQNIKQKVVNKENPAGHSFDALAKIKESSDKMDKYLLWDVKDGRLADMTAVFRSSKERIEIATQMQRGNGHPLGDEYCLLTQNMIK